MISREQRLQILSLVNGAVAEGARLAKACWVIGLSERSLQRWLESPVGPEADTPTCRSDARPTRVQAPANQLSEIERTAFLAAANEPELGALPPSQIVPRLADSGRYLGSESTLYRLLRVNNQLTHRRPERPAHRRSKPRALSATAPNQLISWDITYLPTGVRGIYLYFYVFIDVFSRKIVASEVFEQESQIHASDMFKDYIWRNAIAPHELTLHSDNGAPMKGATLVATLEQLGVARSLSRPSVSNDNPYSEALFRTLKYRPENPVEPFPDLAAARAFADLLVNWYNHQHRHSAIGYVTPAERHAGLDQALLEKRHALYQAARATNPTRWSANTRNWTRRTIVHLNPEKIQKGGKTN